MPNLVKLAFLDNVKKKYGSVRKLEGSQSLYAIAGDKALIYVRYSKIHSGDRTFYGLPQKDLRRLQGQLAVICFLSNGISEPLIVPYSEYEDVLGSTTPASDGQYKVQVYTQESACQLYIAQAGRFNVEGSLGWNELDALVDFDPNADRVPDLTHSHVQTLLGAIGSAKGYDIWVPASDRGKLDWSLAKPFSCRDALPYGFAPIESILSEIDVLWLHRGSSEVKALFEVEHSTSVYSGLLRFNDFHLVAPQLRPTFSVVADDVRRSLFVRQLNRPTFRTSGLNDLCTFLDYANVFSWHQRVARGVQESR
jgi:hypothetical protein